MKKIFVLLGFFLTLLFFQVIQFTSSPTILVSGSNFNIEFYAGHSLGFQSDNMLLIEVLTGVLNSSSTSLTVYARNGAFNFNALNDSTIQVSSPDAEDKCDIDVLGANSTIDLGNSTFELTIITGNNIRILWRWFPHSILDDYTVLGLGLGGVILMVASPTWVALGIRKKGITDTTIENMGYCMILEIIGFGLIIVWLWG